VSDGSRLPTLKQRFSLGPMNASWSSTPSLTALPATAPQLGTSCVCMRDVKESTPVCTFFRHSCVQKPPGWTDDSEVSFPSNRRISAYVRVEVLGVLRRPKALYRVCLPSPPVLTRLRNTVSCVDSEAFTTSDTTLSLSPES